MDHVCKLAPALPYSLGPRSPSRHQQREGGGMKNTSWCWVIRPAAGGLQKFWFWFSSRSCKICRSSLCASLGTSHKHSSLVIIWISLVGSGLGGHSACAASACLASICSICLSSFTVCSHGKGRFSEGRATCRGPASSWLLDR